MSLSLSSGYQQFGTPKSRLGSEAKHREGSAEAGEEDRESNRRFDS